MSCHRAIPLLFPPCRHWLPRSASPFNFISFRFRPLAHRRLSASLHRQKEGKEKKFDYPPGKSRLRSLPSLAPFPCRDRWKGKVFCATSPPPHTNTNTHAETRKINPVRQLYIVCKRLRDGSPPSPEHIRTRVYGDKIFSVNRENKYNNQESAARRCGRKVSPVSSGDRVVVSCWHDPLLSSVPLRDLKNF